MTSEETQVSAQLLRVFLVVRNSGKWLSASEAAKLAKVSQRTARAHCKGLVEAGVFAEVRLHPSHRYAFSPKANKSGADMLAKLELAETVTGGV
jgi:DNA-binding IclR family transcriptional regulator